MLYGNDVLNINSDICEGATSVLKLNGSQPLPVSAADSDKAGLQSASGSAVEEARAAE